MTKAVIYTRVSTDDQAENGYSLRDQEFRLRKFCKDNNFEIVQHYQDDHSAKNFDRPKFNEFLSDIRLKVIKPDIFICVRMDRFSRNVEQTFQMLNQFKKIGIDFKTLENHVNLDSPESLIPFMLNMVLPQVDNERRGLNTKNGMRQAKKEGRWVGTAPKGYSFNRETGKSVLEPNNDSKYINKAFREVAKGIESTDQVRFLLRKEGFKCSKNQFYNILRNKVYIGKIVIAAYRNEPEEIVTAIHEPLVSEELFYQVQDVLEGRKKKQPKLGCKDENLPLRGFLVCPKCQGNLTGSGSLGRKKIKYYYYHCQHGCNARFRADEAHEAFNRYLGKLRVPEEIIELYLEILQDAFKEDDRSREASLRYFVVEVNKVEERLQALTDKFIEDTIDQATYKQTKVRYEKQKLDLLLKKQELENIDDSFMRYFRFGSILLKNLPRYYQEATFEVKRKIVGSIFPEKLIFENNNYRTTKPNEFLDVFSLKISTLRSVKKGQAIISDGLSYKAPPLGLEPRTP